MRNLVQLLVLLNDATFNSDICIHLNQFENLWLGRILQIDQSLCLDRGTGTLVVRVECSPSNRRRKMTSDATGWIFRLEDWPNPFIEEFQRSRFLFGEKVKSDCQQRSACQEQEFRIWDQRGDAPQFDSRPGTSYWQKCLLLRLQPTSISKSWN